MQIPEDRFANVKGIKTRYWQSGLAGDAVVFIHGLGGSIENWLLNIQPFAERYRVFACDLVGFGKSEKVKVPYTADYFAVFIKEFMEVVGLDHAHLIGNSLGGAIAVKTTLKYPDSVDKLVLVASGGFGGDITYLFKITSIPLLGEILSKSSKANTERILKEIVYDEGLITNELVDMYYALDRQPGSQEALLATIRAVINIWGVKENMYRPLLEESADIKSETLILWGEEDTILPVKQAYIANERIPNSRLEIFKQCGHIPQFERPEEFNQLVMDFLTPGGVPAVQSTAQMDNS